MTNLKPRDPAGSAKPVQALLQSSAFPRSDDEGEQASSLIRGITVDSTREIDRLIDDLKSLRGRLENESSRVQRDVADHWSLSQSVIQLTKIVSDSMVNVKITSDAPSTGTEGLGPLLLTATERE